MRNFWYIAANARQLNKKPLARTLLGEALVLFRNELGHAVALHDSCPHRNVQLSKGHCENGKLVCCYHGWQFDSSGKCVSIPSLNAGEAIPNSARTRGYLVVEQEGYVWVWMGDSPPQEKEKPFRLPHLNESGWGHSRQEALIQNGVENLIENFIDCAHTGYVHGGLFRAPASHQASTHVAQVEDGVIIDIDEQNQTNSVLSRLLVQQGHQVTHQDRFTLPSIVQVAYGFGPRRQIIGYQICTPEDEHTTRVYVDVIWRFGLLTPLLKPFIPLVGRVVLHQDQAVLENQSAMIRRYGKHFTSAPCDTANLWIQAARQQAARGEALLPREKQVNFRL